MRALRILAAVALACTALGLSVTAAQAERPPFVFPDGCCYHEGEVVRTVTPPASMTMPGNDDFYAIEGGVAGQLSVVAVAPGDAGYNGGKWAFHSVTWNTSPYLLTSAQAVLDAAAAGDVTITRVPDSDFKCPIQP